MRAVGGKKGMVVSQSNGSSISSRSFNDTVKRDLAVVCCKHKVSVAAPLQNEKKEGKKWSTSCGKKKLVATMDRPVEVTAFSIIKSIFKIHFELVSVL